MSGSRQRLLRLAFQAIHGRAPRRGRYQDYRVPRHRAFQIWWISPPVARSEWRRVKRKYKDGRRARPSMDAGLIRRLLAAGRKRDDALERRRLKRRDLERRERRQLEEK